MHHNFQLINWQSIVSGSGGWQTTDKLVPDAAAGSDGGRSAYEYSSSSSSSSDRSGSAVCVTCHDPSRLSATSTESRESFRISSINLPQLTATMSALTACRQISL